MERKDQRRRASGKLKKAGLRVRGTRKKYLGKRLEGIRLWSSTWFGKQGFIRSFDGAVTVEE